jgi:hypothetical protein
VSDCVAIGTTNKKREKKKKRKIRLLVRDKIPYVYEYVRPTFDVFEAEYGLR